MSDSDLLFQLTPGGTDLVFGDDGGAAESPRYAASISAAFPVLTATALFIPNRRATVAATFPALTAVATVNYLSHAARPLVNPVMARWQQAHRIETGVEARYSSSTALPNGVESVWQTAARLSVPPTTARFSDARHSERTSISSRFAAALRLPANRVSARHQDALRDRRFERRSRFAQALRLEALSRTLRHQDADHRSRSVISSRFQQALPLEVGVTSYFGPGTALCLTIRSRAQQAIRPPAGIWTRPTTPETGLTPDTNLIFCRFADGSPALLFGALCDPVAGGGTVVVPIRRIYYVVNSQSLVRVSDGKVIDGTNLSLSIDVDSWVWGWSASVPARYLPDLMRSEDEQVELEAQINGHLWRLVVERVQRDRRFGSSRLAVSGRGRAAWLADPYAASRTFANTEAQLAQQLMAAALTDNGISLGWTIDWQITDWLVPAGAWSFAGTPIDACVTIANAARAYLQAHPVDQTLRVLPRYPAAPWHWDELTPDIALPEDVCVTEGMEWVDKPAYNTVFVSGQEGGVLAHVTRAGTDGGMPAPMVTDPLITHADAGRQRGIAILSDTGRQVLISLSLPVLEETGIIVPGKVVDYTESGNLRRGVVRAVDVSADFPKVRQTIRIETHV